MEPSLLILAGGLGSRYGGLKQVDGFGPNKEAILDYPTKLIFFIEKFLFIL